MGKRKISEQQEQEAAEAYRQGDSTTTLANRYGVSRAALKFLLRRQGVSVRPPGRPSIPAAELEPKVVQLRLEGVRLRDIARRVGVTGSTVSEILVRRGLHTRLKRGENGAARRKIRPEQEADVVRLYNEGATLAELGSKYGCTPTAVSKTLRRLGVQRHRKAVSPYRNDPAFTSKVLDLRQEGLSLTQIAGEIGVGVAPVARVVRDHMPFGRTCGERHPNWMVGRNVTDRGYVQVLLQPDHPFAEMRTVGGYVLEHRLVMAEYLGRALLPTESVHHIDGNRGHNAIENLQLRIGQHGSHIAYRCADCGSARLNPTPLG